MATLTETLATGDAVTEQAGERVSVSPLPEGELLVIRIPEGADTDEWWLGDPLRGGGIEIAHDFASAVAHLAECGIDVEEGWRNG